MRSPITARWPWAFAAAVLLYLAAGVRAAARECPSWGTCWRRELPCDRAPRSERYACRAKVRECFARAALCGGEQW